MKLARSVSALALVAAACGDPSGPGDAPEPITELPRDLTADELSVISDANAFGFDLLRNVLATDDRANVILSPLSASMALGMTLNGAGSHTFEAMRGALGFGVLDQARINEAYRGLIELLTGLDPAVRFEIANSVWAREGVPFEVSFVEAVQAAFDATTRTRDFTDPATVDEINAWVEERTGGLIDQIVDGLDPQLVMLLINAIVFDGAWTHRFDPDDTSPAPFSLADGREVMVDMMRVTDAEVRMGSRPGYQAVELTYGGQAFSMVVVLPGPDRDARTLAAGMGPSEWQALTDGLDEVTLDQLSLPRFALRWDGYLNDALKAMGMEDAFLPGADFTRLSPLGDSMCIGFVRQKTFMEVDERGTRAAAVTAVGIRATSFFAVTIDRPFVVALRERLSGTLLFLGVVGDPTAEDPGPRPYADSCR